MPPTYCFLMRALIRTKHICVKLKSLVVLGIGRIWGGLLKKKQQAPHLLSLLIFSKCVWLPMAHQVGLSHNRTLSFWTLPLTFWGK